MNPGDPRPLLDRHAARILARWREQLRALPPSSALAAPELLAPMMAPALSRVRHESTRHLDETDSAPEASDCRCGLNPLVTFYLTGEAATFEILWSQHDALAPLAPEAREATCRVLRAAWRRVATEEISLFCSVCQRGAAIRAADHAHTQAHSHAHAAPASAGGKHACLGANEAVLSAWARDASQSARDKF